jgi:hypothetical protein
MSKDKNEKDILHLRAVELETSGRAVFYSWASTRKEPDISKLVKLIEVKWSEVARKPAKAITSPPGSLVLKVTDFLCTKKVYERVFLQAVLDMREEYNEALFSGRKEKARWVLIRSYLSLAWTVALQVFTGILDKIIKTLWTKPTR